MSNENSPSSNKSSPSVSTKSDSGSTSSEDSGTADLYDDQAMLDQDRLSQELKKFDDLVFDLDGTIFPIEDYYTGAFEDIELFLQSELASPLTGLADALVRKRKLRGAHNPHLFDEVFEAYNLPPSLIKQSVQLYRQHDCRHLTVRNSLLELIWSQKHEGKRIFVVTNGRKEVQQKKIDKLKLRDVAEEILICTPDFPDRLKPNPWAYYRLFDQFQLNNSVMIGDDKAVDGGFAKNAGIAYIQFCYHNPSTSTGR